MLKHPSLIARACMVVYEPVVFGLLRATGDEEGLRHLRDVHGNSFRRELAQGDEWFRAFVGYWNGPGAWDSATRPVPTPTTRSRLRPSCSSASTRAKRRCGRRAPSRVRCPARPSR